MSENVIQPITVSAKDLCKILGVGLNMAYTIGKEAGAEVKLGRRCVYNVKKIQTYIESVSRG